jgi:tetratricopeptide (TPR) repeat protein
VLQRLISEFRHRNQLVRGYVHFVSLLCGTLALMPLAVWLGFTLSATAGFEALPGPVLMVGALLAGGGATVLWSRQLLRLYDNRVREARRGMGLALAGSDLLMVYLLDEQPEGERELRLPRRLPGLRALAANTIDPASFHGRIRLLVELTESQAQLRRIQVDTPSTARIKTVLGVSCFVAFFLPFGLLKYLGVPLFNLLYLYESAKKSGTRLALADFFTTEDPAALGQANLGTQFVLAGAPLEAETCVDLLQRAAQHSAAGNWRLMERCSRQALELASFSGEESDARGCLGYALLRLGRYGEAVEQYERCLELARSSGEPLQVIVALGNLGYPLRQAGDLLRGGDVYREALALCDSHDQPDYSWWVKHNYASLLVELGRLAEAGQLLDAATAYVEDRGTPAERGVFLGKRVELAAAVAAAADKAGASEAAAAAWVQAQHLYSQLRGLAGAHGLLVELEDELKDAARALAAQDCTLQATDGPPAALPSSQLSPRVKT